MHSPFPPRGKASCALVAGPSFPELVSAMNKLPSLSSATPSSGLGSESPNPGAHSWRVRHLRRRHRIHSKTTRLHLALPLFSSHVESAQLAAPSVLLNRTMNSRRLNAKTLPFPPALLRFSDCRSETGSLH